MKNLLVVLLGLFSLVGLSQAQTPTGMVPVVGANVQDSTGLLLQSGTITFAPVDAQGNPLSYHVFASGQAIARPVSANIVNGFFSTFLPATDKTNPLNVCFNTTILDNNTGAIVSGSGYGCVQPTAANSYWCSSGGCLFDSFIPNGSDNAIAFVGPQGTTGPSGCVVGSTCTTTLTPLSLNGVISADQVSGSDIGAKINTAFTSCAAPNSSCKVTLPPGQNYSFLTRILIPGDATANHSVMALDCQGSTLTWLGSGDAIQVLSENTDDPTGSISNCKIVNPSGNTTSLAAIHQFSRIWFNYNNNTFFGFANTGGVGIELDNASEMPTWPGYNERTHFMGNSFSFNTKGIELKGSNGGTGSFARTVMLGTECGLNANQICVSIEGTGGLQTGDAYGGTFDIHSNGTTGSRVISLTSGGDMRLGLAHVEGEGPSGFLIYVDGPQSLFQMSGFASPSGGLTNFNGATSNGIQLPMTSFSFVAQANPFAFGEEQSPNPKFSFDGASVRFGMPLDFATPHGTFQLYTRVTTNGTDPEVDATPSTGNVQKNLLFCAPQGCGFGNGYGLSAITGGSHVPTHDLEFMSTFANQAGTVGIDSDGSSYAVSTNYNVHSTGAIINNTGFGWQWHQNKSTSAVGDQLVLDVITPASAFARHALVLDAAGDVTLPNIPAGTGKFYVCIDTAGKLSAQAATCD